MQGGNRYAVNYQRLTGNWLFDAAYTQHDGEVSDLAVIREPSNTVKYRASDTRTLLPPAGPGR